LIPGTSKEVGHLGIGVRMAAKMVDSCTFGEKAILLASRKTIYCFAEVFLRSIGEMVLS
jgi:hypothetical protein